MVDAHLAMENHPFANVFFFQVFPIQMVIFHSQAGIYQRVTTNDWAGLLWLQRPGMHEE